jgi:hypothetical protein
LAALVFLYLVLASVMVVAGVSITVLTGLGIVKYTGLGKAFGKGHTLVGGRT